MKRRLGLLAALVIAGAGCSKDGNTGATCGNGTIDPGEACDGTNVGGRSCLTEQFLTGTIGCNADCTLNISACVARPTCGNGEIDSGEACDGAKLAGRTCESEGFQGGDPRVQRGVRARHQRL